MGTVIAVASGKGGTGKTSFCANVAVALCGLGESVLLIDADAGLRSLDLVLGISDKLLFTYADVADGIASLADAAARHDKVENLSVLTAPASCRVLERRAIERLLRKAAESFSYTIIDCPAGIDGNIVDFCACADRAVVVSTPDQVSLRTAQKVGMLLADNGQIHTKIVVNRVRGDMLRRGDAVNIDNAMDRAGLSLLGVVPEDRAVIACGNGGRLLALERGNKAFPAYVNIAMRLTGRRVRLLKGVRGRF